MKWLALTLQAVIATVLSIAMWQVFGPMVYLTVAALIAFTVLILVITNAVRDVVVNDQHSPGWFVLSVFLAFVLGVVWPLIPIAAAWGDAKTRQRDGASSSSPQGPCSERRTNEGA